MAEEKQKVGHDGSGDVNPYQKREYSYAPKTNSSYWNLGEEDDYYADKYPKSLRDKDHNMTIKIPGCVVDGPIGVLFALNEDGSINEKELKSQIEWLRQQANGDDGSGYYSRGLRQMLRDVDEYRSNYQIHKDNLAYDAWEEDFKRRKQEYGKTGDPSTLRAKQGTQVEVGASPIQKQTADALQALIDKKRY